MADVWANSMACHPRATYCRLLPLGEFTVMIPELAEPHVTLQGVLIPSAILKIVFRHFIFFGFLMQFRLWRASDFVSLPIHLYRYNIGKYLRVCQNFSPRSVRGPRLINVNLGPPIISETTRARKLKLKTQLDVVKYSLLVQHFPARWRRRRRAP